MRDQTLGMIMATAIAAPVVVVCCGGGLVLAGSALAGLAGWFSGAGLLVSILAAIAAGGLVLGLRRRRCGGSVFDHPADSRKPCS